MKYTRTIMKIEAIDSVKYNLTRMKKIKLLLTLLVMLVFQSAIAQSQKSIPSDAVVNEFYDAIVADNNEKIKQLLTSKFPGNYEPKNKVEPIRVAIWQKNIIAVKLLVEAGANINSKTQSAVEEAAGRGEKAILEYLMSKGGDIKNNDAFSLAAANNHYDCAKLLLLKGASQESGDVSGKLKMYEMAVSRADFEVLNKLKLSKEELDANNCEGETALIIAVKQNDKTMVEYLLKRGVNKNKPETFDCGDDTSYGKKPIDIAKKRNYSNIVQLLK
ncbi:ankyrin repeat protein [Solitalea canadensis DSM 3403]|uniref:Ankyrin repeat protein n=2 Tax=Solitalea canadensis TaxID=995 RepID=H8KT65_SOLCM|nr:ankyrin repeat protein [Solitalea canadensis DSM 3403]